MKRIDIHSIKAEVADNFLRRARGLLGRDGLASGTGMLIPKCNAIHTLGMRFPIDAAFLDRDGCVVRDVRDIAPGRLFVWGGWRARQTLETQAASVRARAGIHALVASGMCDGAVSAEALGGQVMAEGVRVSPSGSAPVSGTTPFNLGPAGHILLAVLWSLLAADGELGPDAVFTDFAMMRRTVEKATGLDLASAVRERVLLPLGMADTVVSCEGADGFVASSTVADMRILLADMIRCSRFPAACYDMLFGMAPGLNGSSPQADGRGLFSEKAIVISGSSAALAADPVRGRAAVILCCRERGEPSPTDGLVAVLSHLCFG